MNEGVAHPVREDAEAVVIVGAGFGGLETAKYLGEAGVPVILIDRNNHHLFQPLLYQVATAALSAPDIAEPIRKVLRRYPSLRVVYGEVIGVDKDARRVELTDGRSISYSHLVIAAGSVPFYFGNDSWAQFAPGLKTIEDARLIRSRLLLAFERAEQEEDPQERRRLMTFVIIGGGPTGVELAGSIAELSRHTLVRDFRNISPQEARIILAEGGPRLLGGFRESLSEYARLRLLRLGVEVRTNASVKHISDDHVVLNDEVLPTGLSLWAAGVGSSPLGKALGVPLDRHGRVIVRPDLSVGGYNDLYVIGDLAHLVDEEGKPLPGLAQVAKQQGAHLGKHLPASIKNGTRVPDFKYNSRGNTAIVGRHAAVFEGERVHFSGWVAWMLWALVHVYLLVGFQNRMSVSLSWLWRYLTYDRGARMIYPIPADLRNATQSETPVVMARERSSHGQDGS
ncbi:NAD(P)/FAD-dependent oxidoreductase [Aquamicrobium zhengzhouense]|uniref:NADH:ubiquinone reductase (non-electrogenic) n=1 Tax=Aquamicrobium zhengzhouense TaxID=2781738 RepID=A0ABS0SEW6_9HYPH|nr:NAD(P)/FAD-dependent oxidoreductase [Aquamicrobium zhengzhouense]MBI1621766.1 NAD(P)/FAD-dependent oxidoreductase [Aquamicrobium zhengzhouense]